MGKKGKKASYKKLIGSFVMRNRVMLAALAGAATGDHFGKCSGNGKSSKSYRESGKFSEGFYQESSHRET